MKNNNLSYKPANDYSSTNVTKITCDFLLKNNIYKNDFITNNAIVKLGLYYYSIIKLAMWANNNNEELSKKNDENNLIDYLIYKARKWINKNEIIGSLEIRETLELMDYLIIENESYPKLNLEKSEVNLNAVCQKVKAKLPENEIESYFNQYTHCIMYTTGIINRQAKQITWKNCNTNIPITIIENNDAIDLIVTSNKIDVNEIPQLVLEETLKNYSNEKVLKK